MTPRSKGNGSGFGREAGPTLPRPGQALDVFCWCQNKIVTVPAHWVAEGRTGSCGDCQ